MKDEVPGTRYRLNKCGFISPLLGRGSIIFSLQHLEGKEMV